MFQDRQITCIDCSQPFVFTAGEQEFYERKGFREEPKRCKTCREARKTRKQGERGGPYAAGGMGNGTDRYDEGYGGPQGDFGARAPSYDDDNIGNRIGGPPSSGARGPREVREMSAGYGGGGGGGYGGGGGGGYGGGGGGGGGDRGGRRGGGGAAGGGGGQREQREMHDAVCAQCGVQTRVPFKPMAGRPVYCRDCYNAQGPSRGR